MTNPVTYDGFAQPLPQAPAATQPKPSVIAFLWLVFWLTNVATAFVHVAPVSPYYVIVTPFIGYLLVIRPLDCLRVASRPAFWLWVISALLPLLLYFISSKLPLEAYQSLRVRIIFFSVVMGTAALLTTPEPRRIIRPAALVVLFISISINVLELFAGTIFSNTPGRAAGFYENPNVSAAAIIVLLLLSMDPSKQTRSSMVLMTIGFAGIMTTFSRSGMLFGAALWGYHAFFASGSGRGGVNPATRLLLVVGMIILFGIGTMAALRFADVSDDARARVTGTLQGRTDDGSSLDRLAAVQFGFNKLMESPIVGHGLGAPEFLDLQTHNTYLHIGNEFGALGLLLFFSIVAVPLAKGVLLGWRTNFNQLLLVVFLLYYSMFDHYVHASTVFAVAFGVLLVDGLQPSPERPPPAQRGPEPATDPYAPTY